MHHAAPISATARLLGVAGLLPQLGAFLLAATGADPALGALLALFYATLITSFLGGIWWGFAMGAPSHQPALAAMAVTPTLAAFALVAAGTVGLSAAGALAGIAAVLMLTLLVDRRFAASDLAPPGWLGLRAPLSSGLAVLTVATAGFAPVHVTLTYSN